MKKLIFSLVILLILIVLINNMVNLIVFTSDNEIIKIKPVFTEAARLEFNYIHSVARTPVVEYFRIEENSFILYKTIFESYGAGLPLDGGDFKRENGKFVQEGQNIKIEELVIRVSRTEGQELIVAGEVYELQMLLDPGQRLIVNHYTLWNYIRFKFNKLD